jgi:hypothetical protein
LPVVVKLSTTWVSRHPLDFHILVGTHKRGWSQWRSWNASCAATNGDQPGHEETWQLVFDQNAERLFVRHEWHTKARGRGTLDEFLIQHGAAPKAWLALLLDWVTGEA